jgi:hypothetical protein
MMVIVEDKQGDIKQKVFYDDVAVGGKIRVFDRQRSSTRIRRSCRERKRTRRLP